MTPGVPTLVDQGYCDPEILIIGEGQEGVHPLPAVQLTRDDLLTRWNLTLWERIVILLHGSLYIQVRTYGQPLQALLPSVVEPRLEEREDQVSYCPECEGTGTIVVTQYYPDAYYEALWKTSEDYVLDHPGERFVTCRSCGGSGVSNE